MEGASFGAGRAGAALDPVSFARRPQTLLRVASWVFSIAVFGPIVNEGYVNTDSGPELRCVFNGNAGACRFGVALGLGAFLACAAFLLLDVRFQQISSVRDRRRAVLLDLGFSGLWSFLWFVGFCFLTNQWQRTAPGPGTLQAGDAARAAIAFSFFSILSWVSAAGGGRAGAGAGRGRCWLTPGSPSGGAHCEGPAAVPPGHGHVALCHRTAGRRGGSGLSWLPGGQRRGGHRDLPEPSLHRDPGHQPQRVPGACLLVAGRPPPGLGGCHQGRQGPGRPGTSLRSSWPSARDRGGGHCGPSGAKRG
ncbi:synaptogyrin-3 isoform X1 [Lynx rufus]|uniref:synaptogyrin-3 isoform X1 n=1 Tax=Lynx rufus TaxID=61384 RepID=UPI001F12872B|nr:synaptogyrin-3 isoform X1 [Lynx rufus]